MPRTPAKTERNAAIVAARLQGEKLEALAVKHGISKSRVNHLVREAKRKKAPKQGPESLAQDKEKVERMDA